LPFRRDRLFRSPVCSGSSAEEKCQKIGFLKQAKKKLLYLFVFNFLTSLGLSAMLSAAAGLLVAEV